MLAIIASLVIILALAIAVVGSVAVPARRAGREVLTERGESAIEALRSGPARRIAAAPARRRDAERLAGARR